MSSFCCNKFNMSMFSHIFHSYSKNCLILQLKKYFSKLFFAFFLRSVLLWIYGSSQGFWLNLITLWTFLKIHSLFNDCFKFLMCIKYSVLTYKLARSFLTFSIFIFFWEKLSTNCEGQDIEHQFWYFKILNTKIFFFILKKIF